MAYKLLHYAQKPSGIWYFDFEDAEGKRRRISSGIKTAKMRRPPAEVQAKLREKVGPYWIPVARIS